ncbi:MAG: Flp family type IVb pilin [bacterium]|nr:Flp family type IVb pilin [bacterium]
MIETIRRFVREEDGVTFVEYGMICAVCVLVAFGAWSTLGTNIGNVIDTVAGHITP